MKKDQMEWGKEVVQAGNDIADLATDAGVPGIGLVTRFAQKFYNRHLQKRFEKFVSQAELDEEFIEKISNSETHSDYLYSAFEAVRQTHSNLGVCVLALIYRDHHDDGDFLISAIQSFSQISDKLINSFITLYEEALTTDGYLKLKTSTPEGVHFHPLYNEAVELIRRNIFVMTTGATGHANGPIQGMKWDYTDQYYQYCLTAKTLCSQP